MTAETDLLPCPFCDGNAKLTTRKDESLWSHEIVDWQTVECVDCGVETERTCDGFERTAADVWNTRANLAELQREVEGLRAEVERLEEESYSRLEACGDAVSQLCAAEARAERLAGALRRMAGLALEIVPALEATGVNVSLAADVKQAADAHGDGRGYWHETPKVGGPDWTGFDG